MNYLWLIRNGNNTGWHCIVADKNQHHAALLLARKRWEELPERGFWQAPEDMMHMYMQRQTIWLGTTDREMGVV